MRKLVGAFVVALVATFVIVGSVAGSPGSVIDFEGSLSPGDFITEVSDGAGISGDPVGAAVPVFVWGTRNGDAVNVARIFDSDCEGTCSGGDEDLGVFTGNILIAEEGGPNSGPGPDDEGFLFPINFRFDYVNVGPVTVESLTSSTSRTMAARSIRTTPPATPSVRRRRRSRCRFSATRRSGRCRSTRAG